MRASVAAAVPSLLAILAPVGISADHGAGARAPGPSSVLPWLFGLGFLVLLGMIAWAIFAPVREDSRDRGPDAGSDGAP